MRAFGCFAIVHALLLVSASGQQKQAPASELDRAVDEFRAQTRALGLREDSPAKRTGGGPKMQWHGRVFENFRNDFLDAIPHEIVQRGGTKNLLRRNQFGFNISGPVWIPRLYSGGRRTFFSLSYEGVRERISRTFLRTIPTTLERTGNFSQVVDQAGSLLPVYDPKTTRLNPAFNPNEAVSETNLQHARLPFPENRIPSARLDPVAQRAIAFYPQPNSDAGPFFRNNFFVNAPETNTANGMIAKVDHSFLERHRISVDTAFSNGFLGAPHWFPTAANPGSPDRIFSSRRLTLEHVFTLSSKTINTLSATVSSDVSENPPDAPGAGSDSLGLPGTGSPAFPLFQIQPYLSMGRSWPISRNGTTNWSMSDGVSTRRGKHSLRASGSLVRYQVNTFWPQFPAGSYRFGSGLTSLPGIVNTGHAFASFLLGSVEFAEKTSVVSPSYFRRSYGALSFRDQYEVRPGLTITAGISITLNTPRVERYNRQSTVDLTAINPFNQRPGALVTAGRNGEGPAFQTPQARIDNSLSIAWSPLGDTRTVLRASASRSYSGIPIYTGQWGIQGFSAYETLISQNPQLEPAMELRSGFPPARGLPDLRPEAANDTVADLIDRSGHLPAYVSGSLSIERQLPGAALVTLGYSNSGGRNLLVSNSAANPNAIHPDALVYRDQLNDETFNRSLRPYPQYRGFNVYSSYPLGRYRRDAGYVRLEKRASKGVSLSSVYVYSKQMDDYSGPYGKQDFFNRQNEWSLTPGNPPHYFQLSYVCELPFGNNKPLFNFPDWRKFFADGWSVSGSANVTSGNPIYLRPQFNNTGGVIQALNVSSVPGVNPEVPNRGPEQWFNAAAFDQPADFSLGDVARTHPVLRNPGDQNYDLSVNKRIALGPERTIEFSAVGFNFMNIGNWTDPDNIIGPAKAPNINAGRIIGSRGQRVIQLGLRFSF